MGTFPLRFYPASPVAGTAGQPARCRTGRRYLLSRILAGGVLLAALVGCAGVPTTADPYPPILSAEEIPRAYVKLAVLDVHNDRFGAVEGLAPADYAWAHQALREEAARIGADAVIQPEVRVEVSSFLFFPRSEIHARAIAVRFR
jgi:uncharacterized protein YbjQ (UPF0145 family)